MSEFATIIGGVATDSWSKRVTDLLDVALSDARKIDTEITGMVDEYIRLDGQHNRLQLSIDDLQIQIKNAEDKLPGLGRHLNNLDAYIQTTGFGSQLKELAQLAPYKYGSIAMDDYMAKVRTVVRKDVRDQIQELQEALAINKLLLADRVAEYDNMASQMADLKDNKLVVAALTTPIVKKVTAPKPKPKPMSRAMIQTRRAYAARLMAATLAGERYATERGLEFTESKTQYVKDSDEFLVKLYLPKSGWTVGFRPFVNGRQVSDIPVLNQLS